VILESGFGGTSEAWTNVQPEIAKFTRVISYDRAGLCKSEPGESPRTAKRVAEELHAALKSAGVKPPYVLVGHSAGAAYVRVFASLYPREIAGIVLVDPPQEELLDWIRAHFPHADQLPPERLAKMPAGIRAEWDARDAQIDEMRNAKLPFVPTILISSAKNDQSLAQQISPEALNVLTESRHKWLERTTGSRQIVAQKAGHNIPMEEPELIVDAIRQVIRKKG